MKTRESEGRHLNQVTTAVWAIFSSTEHQQRRPHQTHVRHRKRNVSHKSAFLRLVLSEIKRRQQNVRLPRLPAGMEPNRCPARGKTHAQGAPRHPQRVSPPPTTTQRL
ncbi:unnamed protein product, partial [Ectocarpus sp. 8 AP-2014]